MTSQRYSANKQATKYDLKSSYKSFIGCSTAFAIISAFIFILPQIMLISRAFSYSDTRNLAITNLRNSYEMIMAHDSLRPVMIGILLICCGIIFAVKTFSYITSKKQVNIYYSSPVDRRTMFKNRVISAVCLIASILFVVIAIDAILNIVYFNAGTLYILYHALVLWAESLVYVLIGFSIATISMALCTTIIEGLFFTGALCALPSAVFFFFDAVCSNFLRGYLSTVTNYREESMGIYLRNIFVRTANLNPLFFGKAIGEGYGSANIFSFVNIYSLQATESPKAAGMEYVLPVIIWAVVAGLLLLLARHFFIERKAENSGNHGTNRSVTVFFSLEASVAAVAFALSITEHSSIPKGLAAVVFSVIGTFACYFVLASINRRTLKHDKKELTAPACVAGAMLICVLIAGTGGFGWYSYVPEIDEIKSAYITSSITEAGGNQHCGYACQYDLLCYSSYSDNIIGAFTDKDDLKVFTKVAADVAKKTDDMSDETVVVCYQLKNGKKIYRYFESVDTQACLNILSLTDTKAYRQELEYLMTSDETGESALKKTANDADVLISGFFDGCEEFAPRTVYQSGDVYITSADYPSKDAPIKNTLQLRQALLKDLVSTTYKERYDSSVSALGTILFNFPENAFDDDYVMEDEYGVYYDCSYYFSEILIVPSMTNTISYLKETGEYALLEATDNKTPVKATVLDWSKAKDKSGLSNYLCWAGVNKDYFIANEEAGTDQDYLDSVKEFMFDSFKGGKEITDQNQIKELVDSKTIFSFMNSDDYVVMFEYENEYRSYLIPKENAPSFIK